MLGFLRTEAQVIQQQEACKLVLMSIIHFVCLLTHTSVLTDRPECGLALPPGQRHPHSFLSHVALSRMAFMPASGPLLGRKALAGVCIGASVWAVSAA